MKRLEDLKVLLWDLETAGVGAFSADRGYIVCFGYKWLGKPETHCLTLLDYPGKGKWPENCQDDSRLLDAALEVMKEADLMVAHYGDKFDRPFLECRMLKSGIGPLPRTRQVDTCLMARNRLKLSSNRLGNIAEFLGLPQKKMEKRGGWPAWWMGALRGDRASIKKMAVYCKQDVRCLESVFQKMRPVIPDKYLLDLDMFNLAIPAVCGSCAGRLKRWGFYYSQGGRYQRFVCSQCGKWTRSKTKNAIKD